jgi:Cu(I)/Ag(I) efflux system membrane fusion protein
MNSRNNLLVIAVCSGIIFGALLGAFIIAPKITSTIASKPGSDTPTEPLYWVAPMDPDFRRSGPGRSPMGMDLLPVYADNSSSKNSLGTVTISADVINNLGVRTVKAYYGKLTQTITAPATIEFNENQLLRVQPRIEAWVETLYVHTKGDTVTAGEPLYTLYSPTLVTAQEELLLALNRNNHLLIKGAEQRLLSFQIDPSVIQKIKKSGVVQHNVTMLSPRSGVISELNIREGDYITPGKAIATIAALDSMWAIAEIIGGQGSTITVGDHAKLSIDGIPNRLWSATVDYIYPTLDKLNRSLQLRLKLDNTDLILKPNMFAKIILQQAASASSVLIPTTALIRSRGQNRVVIALGEGRFKAIAVNVGRLNNREAEIVSGLKAGDEVVVAAQFLLDSESSKDSDFLRIHHDSPPANGVSP